MSPSYGSAPYRRLAFGIAAAGALALALTACTSNTPAPQEAAAPPVPEQPAIPSKYRPEDIVGRWGYGAFHRDQGFLGGPPPRRVSNAASRSRSRAGRTAA